MRQFKLANGQTIDEHPNGRWLLADEQFVDAEIQGDDVRVTCDDDPEFVPFNTSIVLSSGHAKPAGGLAGGKGAPGSPADTTGRREDATRWHTLNDFVDVVMPTMNPVDVLVWLVLFRRAGEGGKVLASNRGIAKQTGAGLRSVARAMARLREAGLVTAKDLSRHKGEGASEYRLNIRPATAARADKAPRRATAKPK